MWLCTIRAHMDRQYTQQTAGSGTQFRMEQAG